MRVGDARTVWPDHVAIRLARSVAFLLLVVGGASVRAETALRGRVTDQVSGAGVEGVRLLLDQSPPDQVIDAETQTDTFGFYGFAGIPAGAWRVATQHPGYESVTSMVVTVSGQLVVTNFDLAPLLAGGGNTLNFQVRDVVSGMSLQGVPLAAAFYPSSGDTVPFSTTTILSDSNGAAVLRGMTNGYYHFRANQPGDGTPRPKWLAFSTADNGGAKKTIGQAHSITIQLAPQKQNITLHVKGLNPAAFDRFYDVNQPLADVFVEVTGVEFDDQGRMTELLPTRTGVTVANGNVTFRGLPAISWYVQTKKLGYWPSWVVLNPDPVTGELPDTYELSPALKSNKMWLELDHPYADDGILHSMRVRVQGLKDTNTKGIDFENTMVYYDGPTFHWQLHTIYNLLPGRYKLTVQGHGAGNGRLQPDFFGTDYVEVEDKTNLNENLTWTDAELGLHTTRSVIRGRLFSADNISQLYGVATESPAAEPPPVYRPVRQSVDIEFLEYEGQIPADGPYLKPQYRTVTVTTDTNGEFIVSLPSSFYGLRIPGMTNHWGSHVRLRNYTTSVSIEKEKLQGWPFYTWPHASSPPYNGTSKPGDPLPIRSGHEYTLDIFVRKQLMAISGVVLDDPSDPTTGDLVLGSGVNRARVALTSPGSRGVYHPLEATGTLGDGKYLFTDVLPGTYTVTVSQVRNTFDYGGLPTPFTVTVPSFDAPGVVPAIDPQLYVSGYPFQELKMATVHATYIPSATTVTMNSYKWNSGAARYDSRGSSSYFGTKEVDYIGTRRYGPAIPQGGFTLWKTITAASPVVWFEARIDTEGSNYTFAIYYGGGPSDNVDPNPPEADVDIEFHAYSVADPTYFVSNTTVELNSGEVFGPFEVAFNGFEVASYPRTPIVTLISNTYWVGTTRTTVIDDGTPRYRIDLEMNRATRFTGTVVNASSALPIEQAKVEIRDRFGVILKNGLTTPSGTFDFPAHISGSEPVYVDFTTQGYLPSRRRYDPGAGIIVPDPDDPNDKAVMTINEALTPVPPPTVTQVALNRHGLFLPGVTRVGDTVAGTGGTATQVLTMAWSVTLDATTYNYELPPFDEPDGTPPAPVSVATPDRITEVWLVDPRMYGTPAVGPNDAVFGNPYSDTNVVLSLPDQDNYFEVRTFLDGLGGEAAPGVFFAEAESIVATANPNEYLASGVLPLWKLPPGPFAPVFIALTERGAVTNHQLQYSGSLAGKELEGTALPRWLGFAADAMGAIAGNGPTVDMVADYVPAGRLIATPDYTAAIDEDAANPGYLKYLYMLKVNLTEAMQTPAGDLLDLSPGMLGIQMTASADVSVIGKTKTVGFALEGNLTADDIDVSEYAPPVLARFKPKLAITQPTGNVRTEFLRKFPGGGPYEFELVHKMDAGVGFTAELNLVPLTGKLPYVGPALLTLDKTGGFSLFGDFDARIDLISTTTWRSLFPVPVPLGSELPDTRVARRHFLGGQEEHNSTNKFDLALNFGIGLRAEAAGGRLGASGHLRLAGNPHRRTGRPSLVLEMNQDADWPPIKRVRGKAFAELEAHLDVWVVQLGKSWEWELAAFDKQISTAPTFDLVPLTIQTSISGPSTEPQATFIGLAPTLIQNFFPAGTLQTLGGGTDSMLFTDADTAHGMALRFARRGAGGDWNTPMDVAFAAGIISAAVAARPSGGYVAVWCEIGSADVGNPFPATTLRYATSNTDGSIWTAAVLLANLPGVAAELFLARSGAFLGLLFLETDDGPLSGLYALKSSVWNDSPATWSAPSTQASDLPVRGFDVTGAAAGLPTCVVLVYRTDNGMMESRTWDGAAMAAPVLVDSNAVGGVALEETDPATFLLAWTPEDGGIALKEYDKTNWTDRATPFSAALASGLGLQRLTNGDQTNVLVTWVQGGDPASIWYGYVGVTGEVQQAASNLTRNSSGRYHDVQVLPGTNLDAAVIARFTASPTQVREFHVSFNAGLADDVDGDGFKDLNELNIIDADPDDAVDDLSDVLPDGDFDGDGIDNFAEVFMGIDPTDPDSVLSIWDITMLNSAAVTFPSESGVSYKLQYNLDLLNSNGWTDIATFAGDGRLLTVHDTTSRSSTGTFYRIAVDVPPPAP